jgi:outer membrane protein assembly factor BamA
MDRYRALRLKGVTPMLGSIIPGSSFSTGVELRRERLLHIPIGASFETMWSIRGYHEYDLRIGRIRGDRNRAELRPLDADLTSIFTDGALLAPGLSFSADIRQRVYPRIDFFGLGQQSNVKGRSDFGVTGVSIDGVLQWQHNRHFGASVRAGTTQLSLEPGTNHGVVNLEDRYTAADAPGLDSQPRYRALGLAAVVDYRDKARLTSSGSWLGVAWWKAATVETSPTRFMRVVTDARHFVALRNVDHVLALRAIVSTRVGTTDVPTPFYLQPTLGGSKTLRGFGSYRLRGDAVWAATAEYRWHVQRWVEVAPFVDVGAVADRFGALRNVRPAVTPGIGVRARTSERVIGRLDYASGRDGQRVVITLSTPF